MAEFTLRDVPLLRGLSDEHLALLDRIMLHQRLDRGHVFVKQGKRAGGDQGLFVVRAGQVKISVAKPTGGYSVERTLSEGEAFGLLGLIHPDKVRRATVRAQTQVEVSHLTRGAFLALFHSHRQLASSFQLVLARQLVVDLRKTDEALRTALAQGKPIEELTSELVS